MLNRSKKEFTLTEAELMVSAGIGFLPVASKVKEKTDDGSITSLPFIKNEEILKSKLYAFYKKSFDESIYEKLTSIIKECHKIREKSLFSSYKKNL